MTKAFSRRMFLGSALGFVASQALGEAPSRSLRPVARPGSAKPVFKSAEELVARSGLSGEVGYAVMDVRSGQMREAGQADLGLPPASVLKAVTALYALDALGLEHRFTTSVQATGSVTDGVLEGDLILAGGGDPTLDTDRLADLAAALKAKGIREVTGDFLVWGGFLPFSEGIDADQPEHVGYNPAVSGLNLNYNRVHFQWTLQGSAYQVSMDARSEKYRPDVRFARMAVERRSTPIYTYADREGRDDWTVARAALGKGGARWLPVRKPEIYAGEVFQTFARSQGIVLKAPRVLATAPGGTVLAQVVSPPLPEILRDMLKYSTNLTAEVVGQAATRVRKGSVESLEASAAEMSAWARETYGLGEAVHFVDHSGLGDRSRMTASDMVLALTAAREAGPLRSLLKSIPMLDDSRRAIKNHPVKVDAKTGTLNFVSALAGYVTATDGAEMAFAIFTADVARRDALTRDQRERPEGGREWITRSKRLQQKLLQRWGQAFGST
ncbi:MAG: D-alanyl-D-alanine carboxypeptidase/D-alanyl-D-alanine-endopeptidase [Rhodobacteraceae bacterium]|nr:MAG: D-alanyl-D-alanine carboxypeptidase/D-alanyl-D-alanine-endopeptidase [Paracoccaceae bacterium]